MKKKEIIQELEKIKKITSMTREELYEKYPQAREYISVTDSIYPGLNGIVRSELGCLIERIEKNEFR